MGKKNVIVRFRTAMSGFHKGDVTRYVVKIHEEHAVALAEMEKKCAVLEQENENLRQTVELDRLTELEAQNHALTQQVQELEAKVLKLSATGDPQIRAKELEAYRRAEAMERRAAQRYQLVKGQVGEISDAMVREMSDTVDSAKSALDAIGTQIDLLQNASQQLGVAMHTGMGKLECLASDTIEN